jgi:hypothetical protein
MAACIATCDADELHKLRVAGWSRRGHIERNINALARALKVGTVTHFLPVSLRPDAGTQAQKMGYCPYFFTTG